jgi:pectate lyase
VHVCIVLVLALVFTTSLHAAFEGFGSSTPGGNNGATTVVTSLADTGPGSLRAALAEGDNQRIVFAVAGTINLASRLELRGREFITIDGSTAPDPGVTLEGNGFYIRNSHDIVITHLQIRDSVSDGITLWDNSYNIVFDHLSVSNSADGNIDITEDTRNVTISWCVISDTRSNSLYLKTKGVLIASFKKGAVTDVSLHHNLFINQFQRSPQISSAGLFDIRNNVIKDWGAYGIRIRAGAQGNVINNVFITTNNARKAVLVESNAGPIHIAGNQGPGSTNVNELTTHASPFAVAPVKTDPVTEVEKIVLRGAGAFPRNDVSTLRAGSPFQNTAPSADTEPDQVVSEGSVVHPR